MNAIILSDIHIGADNCQAKLLVDFLEKIHNQEIITQKLILNGDVFENFDARLHKWHWKILSTIRSISDTVEVVWVKGNHDVGPALPIAHLIGAEYYDDHYIFESGGKKIICVHGDIFDDFLTDHPVITYIADIIYWLIQKIDKSLYLAKIVKHKSKTFVRCVETVKDLAIKYKDEYECDLVCCGHTHYASMDGDYFNSGSWTELPPTYLTVNDGEINITVLES